VSPPPAPRSRFEALFAQARAAGRGVFVPFTVLGDPDLDGSLRVLDALVAAGADALEVGLPFTDPIADGPVVARATARALAAGANPPAAFALLSSFRARHPEVPVGLLTYANLVERPGPRAFYREVRAAGVDAVLVADVPLREAAPYVDAAQAAGIDPVFVVPMTASEATLNRAARLGRGFTYVLGHAGVTGARSAPPQPERALFARLDELGAPPALVGFGVSEPAHLETARVRGAAGAIVGSALVRELDGDQPFDARLARLAAAAAGFAAAAAARADPSVSFGPKSPEEQRLTSSHRP